jgi:hypothetical protein
MLSREMVMQKLSFSYNSEKEPNSDFIYIL